MKLRKFFGLTSRSVLEQVRAELGADAVIVANHATPDGVEVTALAGDAIDTLLAHQRRGDEPAPQPAAPLVVDEPVATASIAHAARAADSPSGESIATPVAARSAEPADGFGPRVMAEVAAMRDLIEDRLAHLSWNDALRRRPLAAKLVRELLAAGYSAQLARSITERLPDDMNANEARAWVMKLIARNLRCTTTAEEIVTRGGIYALIGPTGVGKTTTTAKLAARCAVRYGAHRLALITTDSFRIGAQDQLRIYAKILGVAVHTVSDRHDLRQALDAVRGRHLVLIDTVGMGQRDARVAEQAMLLAQPEIRTLLLLNAASQGETLDEVVDAYQRVPDSIAPAQAETLAGCIITKQDEASRQGTVLDVAIRRRLPVHYVTCGQRVPEDLFVPNAALMVQRAMRSATKPSAFAIDEDDLPLAIAGASAGALHA
jgi:flagellar biosynthesis protein FlhF